MITLRVDRIALNSADIPIRWCIDCEMANFLKCNQNIDPYLLLVVVREREGIFQETERILVPFWQMMTYVTFRRPGPHRVYATLVWHEKGKRELFSRFFDQKRGRDYEHHLINGYATEDEQIFGGPSVSHQGLAVLHLELAPEFFAVEPPRWEQKWVNLRYHQPPRDQCEYRRRRLYAYLLQPFVLAWILPWKYLARFLVLAVLILAGIRKINWWPLWHPLRSHVADIWDNTFATNSIFWRDGDGHWHPLWVMGLTPLWLIAVFGGTVISFWYYELWRLFPGWTLETVLWLAGGVVIGMVIAGFILSFMPDLVFWALSGLCQVLGLHDKGQKLAESFQTRVHQRQVERERERTEAEAIAKAQREQVVNELLCDVVPSRISVKTLPPHRRTYRLRFRALKARVCKPFAEK